MAFDCKTNIACSACTLTKVSEESQGQPLKMGSDKLTAAVRNFFTGILHEDLQKIEEALKYVDVDNDIDTEIIYSLIAFEEEKNGAIDSNLNIPRVPRLLPLHLACACGNGDVVKMLLTGGAEVDAVLDDGETALHFACLYGNVACVRELVGHGGSVNYETRGDTPLMLTTACYGTSGISMKQNYLDIANILINNGCDINIPDSQGLTPVHLAAGKEDPELLKMLIQAGAEPNVKARAAVHPNTPLIGSVSAELEENVRILLSAGCDVNQVVYPGLSALSSALDNNALGIVLDLLKAGANPRYREDILDVQMYLGNKNYLLVMLLLSYGLEVNWQNSYDRASILLSVTRKQCMPMVKWMLSMGADIDLENCLGTTPLWAAVKLNDIRLVRVLTRWNCDLDISSIECNPLIPLVPIQLATQMGHFAIAKYLLYFRCLFKTNWLNFTSPVCKAREATEFRRYVRTWMSNPLSLQHHCILTIRGQLGPGLPRKVRTLRIPTRLKRYLITGNFVMPVYI